jgi:hypothetical protein
MDEDIDRGWTNQIDVESALEVLKVDRFNDSIRITDHLGGDRLIIDAEAVPGLIVALKEILQS